MDQAYLEHHPYGEGKRFFPGGPKHTQTIPSEEVQDFFSSRSSTPKAFLVRKQKILSQSP